MKNKKNQTLCKKKLIEKESLWWEKIKKEKLRQENKERKEIEFLFEVISKKLTLKQMKHGVKSLIEEEKRQAW